MAKIGVAYIEVTGDLTKFRRALAQVDEGLKRTSKQEGKPKLDLDSKTFDLAYKEGLAKLVRLDKKRARAVLDLDVKGIAVADRQVEALQQRLAHMKANIDVDVDQGGISRLLSGSGGRGGIFGGLLGSSAYKDRFALTAVAAASLAGALNSVAAASLSVGAALAPLAGLLAVIPNAVSGIAQAGGALFATFGGISDAVKGLGDATVKSAVDGTAALEKQRSATDAVRSAKSSLADAQRNATVAQEGLTEARQNAVRTLADMKNQARDAQLAEQGSALALREAQAELNRIVSDPKSTQLEIERAQLGIKQARQGAKEARIEAARAKADSDRAQAGGVDKTPEVVSARRQLADANRNVVASTRALARAQQQAASGGSELSASQQKVKDALDKLSPAGQRFARFLHGLRPAFRSIRNASQEAALPHFQKGIEGAMKNLPTFRQALTNTSRVLGVAAENFGKFTGSKAFGRDLKQIGRDNNNVLRNFGRAAVPLGKAFADIAVAAGPFVRWLGRIVLHLARLTAHSAKAGRESGGLAKFLHRTRNVMESLGKIIGNLVHGLGGLFKNAFPEGQSFLKMMERLTDRFDEWSNSVKGRDDVRDFFERAKGPLSVLGESLGSIAKMIRDLLAAPGSGKGFELFARTMGLLADSIAFLARIPGVGGAVANLALLTVVAGRYGKLGALARGLTDVAGGMRGITAAESAAGGTPLRKFGTAIRNQLSRLGRTRIGETIAGNIAAGLGVGAIRVRKALDSIKGLMNRILGRAGIAAGTSAAEGAAANLAAETLPTGKLGGLRGKFSRLGQRLGTRLSAGIALGLTFGLALVLKEASTMIDKWVRENVGAGGKLGGFFRETFTTLLPKIKPGDQGPLLKLMDKLGISINAAKKDAKDLNAALGSPTGKGGPSRRGEPRKVKEPTPSRSKVVEIQTPILSLRAGDVEKSMNRIQRVLRRELDQISRLMRRRVLALGDVFEDLRLIKGRDPFGLEAALRRTGDDSEGLAERIAGRIGSAFESISRFARLEGREVIQEFARMNRQGSNEARDFASNLRSTFGRLPTVVGKPVQEVLRIVATAMRALGASGISRITAATTKVGDKIDGRAFGGVVPGYSQTDDHIVAVRGGEAVLRPEDHVPFISQLMGATKAMGMQPYGSLGEMFQRSGAAYARGGMVDPTWDPGAEVLNKGISGRVGKWARRYGANMTAGFDPGGSHVSPGHNVTGTATDMVPLAGWGAGPTKTFERGLKALAAQGLKVLYGTDGIGMPWPNHGRGNHAHIEWGGGGEGAKGAGLEVSTPRVRVRTEGPAGGVRSTVRGALQKVAKGANRRLERADGAADLSGFTGGGGSTANMRLGRRMMNKVFGENQWGALRELWSRESGWRTNADNPTSDAYGIPQSLPGSKMRSAGKDWATNPATQIKWGLRYIKGRYGSPSAALRFHDAHNWYAKGGFVKGYASGGTVRNARLAATKSRGKTARPRKLRIPKRVRQTFSLKLFDKHADAFDALTDETTGTIAKAVENYTVDDSDANLTQEEYNDESGAIRWEQVDKRLSEIRLLQGDVGVITTEINKAIGIATKALDQIKRALLALRRRRDAILDRARYVLRRIKSLAQTIKEETEKGRPNKTLLKKWRGERDGFQGELQRLVGSKDSMAAGGQLGEIGTQIGAEGTGLIGLQDTFGTGLVSLQGATGRAGLRHDYANIWTQLENERIHDLGDKLKATGDKAGATDTSAAQIKSFLAALGDLQKTFGSNFRPLQTFHQGGIIQGTKGKEVLVKALPGEGVIKEDGSNLTVVIDPKQLEKLVRQSKVVNIDARHSFANVPKDPHGWSRNVKFELEAAV